MAGEWLEARHDIGITNVGTDGSGTSVIGMLLAQTKTGEPAYAEFDGRYLVDSFYTSRPTQVNTEPEQELILTQDDWRTGFGLQYYDYDDPKRYYSSIGCDLRFKNRAMLSWSATGIALPTGITTAASITNGDMELAANWTNGARDNTHFHSGAFGWMCNNVEAYQDAATWDNSWQSKTFTFSCWVWDSAAGNSKIGINDGVGTTYSSAHTGDSSWQWLTVTKTLNVAATRLRVLLYSGIAANGWFDDARICSPANGACIARAEFNDEMYIAHGQSLSKLNATGDGFTFVRCFAKPITDLAVFGEYLYIALGTSTDSEYNYMSTAEAFVESTAANKKYKYFCSVNSATPTIWGSDSDYTIRSNTNPVNGGAAWSGQTTVDSSFYTITDMITFSGALYIMKDDKPYYLDSTGAVQDDLAPELESLIATTSGKNAVVYKKEIFIPCGDQALLKTDGTTNEFISPALYCTDLAEFNGKVQALAFDDQYLFAILDYGTKVEVLAGRTETIDSETRWVWHPYQQITLAGCETAWVSNEYQKRLWITSTSSSDSVYYIPLPTGYGDVTNDSNKAFATGGYFTTSYLHGGFKSDTKAFVKIVATLGHTYDADIYWECHYKKLGDSAWTDAGDFIGTSTNRKATLYIPVDGSANKPISTMMSFKFVGVTDDTAKTPVLNSYEVKAILYPTIKKITHCVIRCANNLICNDGAPMLNMATTTKETLDNARNATWPVSIRDINGDTKYVKFLPVPRDLERMMITKKEKGRNLEKHLQCLMLEVALS
jgi:hypothetical protein